MDVPVSFDRAEWLDPEERCTKSRLTNGFHFRCWGRNAIFVFNSHGQSETAWADAEPVLERVVLVNVSLIVEFPG